MQLYCSIFVFLGVKLVIGELSVRHDGGLNDENVVMSIFANTNRAFSQVSPMNVSQHHHAPHVHSQQHSVHDVRTAVHEFSQCDTPTVLSLENHQIYCSQCITCGHTDQAGST